MLSCWSHYPIRAQNVLWFSIVPFRGFYLPDQRHQVHLLAGSRERFRSGRSARLTRRGNQFDRVGQPERLKSLAVTAEFFRTLGVQPSLGRAFPKVKIGQMGLDPSS